MLLFVQRQFEAGNIIAQEFVDFGKPHGFESGKLRGFGFGEFIVACFFLLNAFDEGGEPRSICW